ncbi:MAG: c-type cytochrome [Alphaproteobacteria bacterium]|nr:c-type cytochrome [Alphaproteobacteria bacterium]
MNTTLLTKISGAVLLTALVAMVVSFAGNILVPVGGHGPAHGAGHGADAGHGAGSTGEAPETVTDPPVAQLLAAADLEAGKKLSRRCVQCHTLEKGGANKLGPNLYGVIGSDRGARSGFNYSAGMKSAGGKWTYEALYAYLRNPNAAVKGTKMSFKLPKPDDRANLISFLRTLAESPLPLPTPKPAQKPETKKPAEKAPEAKKPEEKKAEAAKPAEKAPTQTASAGALLAAADAARGAVLAKSKCRACHSFQKGASHKVGPNLYGVVLRERGAVEGYRFSGALKAKTGKWSYGDLLAFLADPKGFVKGTKMVLRVKKPKDRADLVAYLRTLHESPPPLPAK